MRVVDANQLLVALQQTVEAHYATAVVDLGYGPLLGTGIKEWHQVPEPGALVAGKFPAAAVDSPGLVTPPTRSRASGWSATWRCAVGVYDRGRTHEETATKVRAWAAVIRAVVLDHPSLGGVARSTDWVGEEYAQMPGKAQARTIGGCAVAFDVTATNVADLTPTAPLVGSTQTSISVTSGG